MEQQLNFVAVDAVEKDFGGAYCFEAAAEKSHQKVEQN